MEEVLEDIVVEVTELKRLENEFVDPVFGEGIPWHVVLGSVSAENDPLISVVFFGSVVGIVDTISVRALLLEVDVGTTVVEDLEQKLEAKAFFEVAVVDVFVVLTVGSTCRDVFF